MKFLLLFLVLVSGNVFAADHYKINPYTGKFDNAGGALFGTLTDGATCIYNASTSQIDCDSSGGSSSDSPWGRTSGRVYLLTSTDNVGIGTSNPGADLELNSLGGATKNILRFTYGTNPYALTVQQFVTSGNVSYPFSVLNNGTTYLNTFVIDKANVGIGSLNPGQGLDVIGNIRSGKNLLGTATGATTQLQGSALPTAYKGYGDSTVTGALITTPYPDGVGAAKGLTTTNGGHGNTMVMDFGQYIYAETPTASTIYSIGLGVNDARKYQTDATKLAYFKTGLQALAAWLATYSHYLGTDTTNITYVGTWSTSTGEHNNIGRKSSTGGDTATWTAVGRTVYVSVPVLVSGGGSFTITIDGVSQGTFNNSEAADVTSVLGSVYGPKLLRFSNLSDGTHTVIFTVSSGTAYLDWVGDVRGGQGSQVLVTGVIRQTAAGYASNGGSDTITANYNKTVRQAVRELSGDGLNVQFVDMVQYLDNIGDSDIIAGPDGSGSVGIHPTQQGTDKQRDAILNAMSPFVGAKDRQAVKNLGYIFNDGLTFNNANGNLGIGTLLPAFTPTARLHVVQSAAGDAFKVDDVDANDSTPFVIDQAGNVGIGSTTASDKLQVLGDIGLPNGSRIYNGAQNNSVGISVGNTSGVLDLSGYSKINLRSSATDVLTQSIRMTIEGTNGNVGIGTVDPTSKFSVSGGDITFAEDTTARYIRTRVNGGAIRFRSNSGAASDRDLQFGTIGNDGTTFAPTVTFGNSSDKNGNVGIGTTVPMNTLAVVGGGSFGSVANVGIAGPANGLYVQGNVGIGSLSPGAPIDVFNGTARPLMKLYGNGGSTGSFMQWLYTTAYFLDWRQVVNSGDVAWYLNQTNNSVLYSSIIGFQQGNIGIGTLTPGTKLDVTGAIRASSAIQGPSGSVSLPSYTFGTDLDTGMYSGGANDLRFATGGVNNLTLVGGNVGVGTVTAAYTVDVVGSIHTSGNSSNSLLNTGGGNVGIGTTLPVKLLQVGGDAFFDRTTSAIIWREPDGTCGSCTLSNSEVFTCVSVTCP